MPPSHKLGGFCHIFLVAFPDWPSSSAAVSFVTPSFVAYERDLCRQLARLINFDLLNPAEIALHFIPERFIMRVGTQRFF